MNNFLESSTFLPIPIDHNDDDYTLKNKLMELSSYVLALGKDQNKTQTTIIENIVKEVTVNGEPSYQFGTPAESVYEGLITTITPPVPGNIIRDAWVVYTEFDGFNFVSSLAIHVIDENFNYPCDINNDVGTLFRPWLGTGWQADTTYIIYFKLDNIVSVGANGIVYFDFFAGLGLTFDPALCGSVEFIAGSTPLDGVWPHPYIDLPADTSVNIEIFVRFTPTQYFIDRPVICFDALLFGGTSVQGTSKVYVLSDIIPSQETTQFNYGYKAERILNWEPTFQNVLDIQRQLNSRFNFLNGAAISGHAITWDDTAKTIAVDTGTTTLQVGQETYVRIKNDTGVTINNGTAVGFGGALQGEILGIPYSAQKTSPYPVSSILGVATEDILAGATGFVTFYGIVHDLDTSTYTVGTTLYVDPLNPGQLTDIRPNSPDRVVSVGSVSKIDVLAGELLVRLTFFPNAIDVAYDNDFSELSATTVQAAVDELHLTKASVDSLSSNITTYFTNVPHPTIPGYFLIVDSVLDPNYPTIAVDVPTGLIGDTPTLIASYAPNKSLFVGNPGVIGVSVLSELRKISGNRYAKFYFELYHRTALGTETLIGTSNETDPVLATEYTQGVIAAILNNGTFEEGDLLVQKFYAYKTVTGGNDPVYEVHIGGDNPARTLIPVPVSVIPSDTATDILTDVTSFNGALSVSDTNVQIALETLDDVVDSKIPSSQIGVASGIVPLDTNVKIPTVYIPDSVLGQVSYSGLWDASTNTPTLPASPAVKGEYYIVSVAGSIFGLSFEVGDWIISNGTSWDKVDNTDAVSSVAGRTGNVLIYWEDVQNRPVNLAPTLEFYTTDGSRDDIKLVIKSDGTYELLFTLSDGSQDNIAV